MRNDDLRQGFAGSGTCALYGSQKGKKRLTPNHPIAIIIISGNTRYIFVAGKCCPVQNMANCVREL